MLKTIKKEIRILAICDAPFNKFKDKKALAVGTVFRGGSYLDGFISFNVNVDGKDSTQKIINAVKKTKHYGQLQCIFLKGIALAGFNVIDIQKISKQTNLPVIVIMRKMPDMKKIESALRKMRALEKMQLIKKAGKVYKAGKIYFQCAGISSRASEKIIKVSSTHSLIPEPLRAAHIIASGIKI